MKNKQTFEYKTAKSNFYLGDSLEVLRSIPDNSIDLTVTSPPYSDQREGTYSGFPHILIE